MAHLSLREKFISYSQLRFTLCCIDLRFDSLVATFFTGIGLQFNYYNCSTAGASLCLAYKKYCKTKCHECGCDPNNKSIITLKKSVLKNLKIALTLKNIKNIFLLNHQDCGAIRAFLKCSGYPGKNNKKEIKINQYILEFAVEYMKKNFPEMVYELGLIDINGSVALYDPLQKFWVVIYVGEFNDPKGLWFGLKVGDIYKV